MVNFTKMLKLGGFSESIQLLKVSVEHFGFARKQLPPDTPQYFSRANGCRLWDVDGNEYIDFLSSYGPIVLGHHHPRVDEAAARQQRYDGEHLGGSAKLKDGEEVREVVPQYVARDGYRVQAVLAALAGDLGGLYGREYA